METQEIINQVPFEPDLYSDFEIHLKEIVIERFKKYENETTGKHLYRLRIIKTPDRTNYHTFDYKKLNDISRYLINGMTSLGTIPNRLFWNKYFEGGVRTISIIQNDPEVFPSFNLNYLVYSEYDNLDVRIITQLSTRLRMIDSTLTCKLEYFGSFDISIIEKYLDSTTIFELDSHPVVKLGKKILV